VSRRSRLIDVFDRVAGGGHPPPAPTPPDVPFGHPAVQVRIGEIVTVGVDRIYLQDGNSPTIAKIFQDRSFQRVFDSSRVDVFFDHSVLLPNIEIADRRREAEAFCEALGLQVFRAGEGISHVVAQEIGWFEPRTIVVGSDSHTCTGGAVQCLALGMGASDVAAAMVTGETWLRVPSSVCLEVRGAPGKHARAKDVLLHALFTLGQEPFLYRSIEWTGGWVEGLTEDAASTVANMGVEFGAKCVFLPARPSARPGLLPIRPREGAYAEHLTIDVEGLPPFIARPRSPSNAVPIDDCRGQAVHHVFIEALVQGHVEAIANAGGVSPIVAAHAAIRGEIPGQGDLS
jgi:3-isopropylmalate/(R)-2-methylmalate dehydratase large subunit